MPRDITDISENKLETTAKDFIYHVGVFFIVGVLLGLAAKYSDTVIAYGLSGMLLEFISNITTRLGIWVVLATIIAFGSRSPKIAAIRVFTFFVGMLLAYYLYSQFLFGFFPKYYFLCWGIIALFSPFAAYLVWFSRGTGWFSAFSAGLPIGLLLQQGLPFFYVFSAVLGFDIIAAMLLLIVLPKQGEQRLKAGIMGILTAFILTNSNILVYLFGGL